MTSVDVICGVAFFSMTTIDVIRGQQVKNKTGNYGKRVVLLRNVLPSLALHRSQKI